MKKYILLVEDNEDDIELTLRAFNKYNNNTTVITVRDGEQALKFLFENNPISIKPNLILMDINMPKITGIEVLKRLKQNEKTKHIPVLMLTSSDETDDIIASYSLGANSYIRKPVDYNQFYNLIKKIQHYWITNNVTAC